MIFNMVGGSGGSGATLVVSSPANVSVTVSKDDKSYTKNSGSLGSTTFKGLATGTWTVTISGNGQTATKTIEITADYAVTITYFSATIVVTYPSGSTCTCTDGTTTLTAVGTTGSYTFTVPNAGEWTVSCTDGSNTASKDVSITEDKQNVQLVLSYDFLIFKGGIGSIVPLFSDRQSNSSCKVSKNSISQNFSSGSNFTVSVVRTSEAVDLKDYSELVVEATCSEQDEESYWAGRLCISKNAFGVDDEENVFAGFSMYTADSVRKLYSLDISSFNGAYYVGSWGSTRTTIYNIYLSR